MENERVEKLIKDLEENIYCRLRPSTVSGVGVFAIRNIPKGTDPFKTLSPCNFIDINLRRILENDKIDSAVKDLAYDMSAVNDGIISLSDGGLNSLSIGFFVNHSNNPNLTAKKDGAIFVTARDIMAGEELFSDYRTYTEDPEAHLS